MAKRYGSAGTTRSFLKTVERSIEKFNISAEDVLRNSALDMFDKMKEATPVDTGNLRNSLVVSVNGPSSPTVTGPGLGPSDDTFRSGAEQSISNIMSAKVGDKISFYYGAVYARIQNYGFSGFDKNGRFMNIAGKFWIERVGSQWRSTMRAVANKFKVASK